MILSNTIVDKIFTTPLPNTKEIEQKYPKRVLPEGALVARFAPSPTGFLHIGGVMTSFIGERLAHQSGGIFYLRLEDTDQKREVEGARELIIRSLHHFGIFYDEGAQLDGTEAGNYGPYTQSLRKEIYQAYVKWLLEKGDAYICFATPEQLEDISKRQMDLKVPMGYWGEWAIWRHMKEEDVLRELDKGTHYVIRLRSTGNPAKRIKIFDMLRGTLEFPENCNDIVIMKNDGLPTYHFAHAIDDHLMGTTHVIRSDEWIASLPTHVQLFDMLGFPRPIYGHVAPIQKMDGESRRKLSKRKDPEANIEFYIEQGYPKVSLIEYVLNLANSKFEEWRRANPTLSYLDYQFDPKNINNSGALLDFVKLDSVSANLIGRMSLDDVYNLLLEWAKVYDSDFANKITTEQERTKAYLNIERGGEVPRKDIAKWSQVKEQMLFVYDDWFASLHPEYDVLLGGTDKEDALKVLQVWSANYDQTWSQEVWLEQVKKLAVSLGYADSPKALKQAPDGTYKGHFGAIAMVLRIAITGSTRSPELSQVMKIIGKEECLKRMKRMELALS